jgi:hypothetical protein
LVTFKACQFVTGGGVTEILGTYPGRILAEKTGMAWRRRHPLHAALRQTLLAVPFCTGPFRD